MKFATIVFAVAAVLLFSSIAFAQTDPPYSRNAVYLEGLGQGVLYSINIDHRFSENIAVRVGFSAYPGQTIFGRSVTIIPILAEFLSGGGSNHIEFDLGIVSVHTGSNLGNPLGDVRINGLGSMVSATATVGYRYQPPGEGILFRIGATPFFTHDGTLPWLGISVGYAF